MEEQQVHALDELLEELRKDEVIEAVVFNRPDIRNFYGPNGEDFIPPELIGVALSFEEAKKYFYGWNIENGFGSADVIPFFAWTNQRVLFIGTYDGSTWIDCVPRNPVNRIPYTVGGG